MRKFYFTLLFLVIGLFGFGQSTEVGVTEGELSVSLNGNANYFIPIKVPKGINNIEPQISLSYNSQNGLNGNAARGWDISGISSITRIPATKFHDGVIDPVDFNSLDRFALDGQRLIVKSGTNGIYGADKTIYETEYFSNIKITSYGVSPFGANYGPAYFLVEYPDGSKAYYGNSTDSGSIMEWSIHYYENAQGVRINYNYILLNNALYVDSIKFGALGNNSQPNEIKFTYEDRGVPDNIYVGGKNIIISKRLKEIKVFTNGVGFRNYSLSYLNVDRINKFTETSGDGTKSYIPTVFDYNMDSEEIKYIDIITSLDIGNVKSLNAAAVSGDFDADGKMDCIVYPALGSEAKTKYWLYAGIESGINFRLEHNVGAFDDIFPATFLSSDNKVLPQGWVITKKTNTDYTFTVYSMDHTLGAVNIKRQYDRVVSFPKNAYTKDCKWCDIFSNPPAIFPKKIITGDFNGDGLTDILAIDMPIESAKECKKIDLLKCEPINDIVSSRKIYFVDLKRDNTANYFSLSGELVVGLSQTSRVEVGDFDGDGKSDVFVFDQGYLTVYSLDTANKIIVLYRSSSFDNVISNIPSNTTRFPILIGDYNGDGKSDFMIPKAYGSSQWFKYTSTGTAIIKEEKSYVPVFTKNDSNNTYNYIATDFNNDGRSDLIKVLNFTDNAKGYITIQCFGNTNGDFVNNPKVNSTGPKTDINIYALPVYLPQSLNASNSVGNKVSSTLEIAFFNQNKIHFFNSGYDYKKQNLLTNITTGNGVQESISYIPLNSQFANTYQNTQIYNPSKGIAVYPNLDILIDPNIYVVSKQEQQSKDNYKMRLFAYNGAVSNVEGIGFMGFRSITQTDWCNDNTPMFSNIVKNDMDLRGANVESYFMIGFRGPFIDTFTNYLTKSVSSYESNVLTNKVFRLRNVNNKRFNTLTNVNSEQSMEYDVYDNLLKRTTVLKEGSFDVQTTVSNVDYYNNLSSPYIIGRPVSKSETNSVTGSTMNSEENYDYYAHGLLKQTKTRGTNTNYITEDNEYDSFGNIVKKRITAVDLAPRETTYEYDSTGRFLTKITDPEKLSTIFEYNTNGTLKSETNPFGLTTSYTYDSWFKKLAVKNDKLNKTISYTYTRNGEKPLFQLQQTH